ncbi:hypothetical protein [Bradyrhizobium sp.]|uniref:hypothetical protein n=1 Tax=Bradyrhizobium sp. TaxID=376 RepID=UPI003C34B2E0
MNSDHAFTSGLGGRGKYAQKGFEGRSTSATFPRDNNWRWARRLERDERVAEAQIRNEEAAAIKALAQDE